MIFIILIFSVLTKKNLNILKMFGRQI